MATTASITVTATQGARVYSAGGGAGASLQLPVGLWAGDIYRAFLQFANPDYVGINARQLISATLRLTNSTPNYVSRGANPRMFVRRVNASWKEGGYSVLSPSNAVTWANQPGTDNAGAIDTGLLFVADNVANVIDITTLFGYLLPTTVKRADGSAGGGLANYGLRLSSWDETATTRTTEFDSDDFGSASARPQLILQFQTNSAPLAPTLTGPIADADGNAVIAPIVSGAMTFSGTRNDTDTGDYIKGVEVAVFADTATDAVPGTAIASKQFAVTGSPTSFSVGMPVTGLTVGTTYRARVRTQDRESVWGAWGSLLTSRFKPDTIPSPPSNLSQDANTQTPNFYGSLVDPDVGATISQVRIVVEQPTAGGTVLKWDSDWVASGGTRFAIAYSGTTLDYGTQYRWYAQVRDNVGGESNSSATQTWTPVLATGPTAMSPITIETKQNTLTPVLTVGNGGAFTNHRLEVAKFGDGTSLLWQPALGTAYASTTTKNVTYAGAALTYGRIFYWRAQVLVGGTTWSEWSPWYPFYIDAVPDKPIGSVLNASPVASGVYGDYVTVPTTTPTLRFPFSDPDLGKGYADAPTRREIEIIRADTLASVSGSPFVITTGITSDYTTAALTSGVTYKARARYDDNANVRGPFSDYIVFKVVTPLTITQSGTVDVTDPTPTIAWTLNRAQAAYRVLVFLQSTGDLVYDSGLVMTATTSVRVPGYLLSSGQTYRATVTAYDTDMLSATLP